MRLGEYSPPSESRAAGAGSGREPPRMHVVRGHYVSRGSKTFWRTSHLRGSGRWTDQAKTVRVKGARSSKPNGDLLPSPHAQEPVAAGHYWS